MFERMPEVPPDAIYSLTTACNADPNPRKLNLGVGVFKDQAGNVPILNTVKTVERAIWEQEATKNYLPIDGLAAFGLRIRRMILGAGSPLAAAEASVTVQTPGGTGALRLACELIARHAPEASLWISRPTWANHAQIGRLAGVAIQSYPYYDADRHELDADAFLDALHRIPAGDALLLHGCCHNPTGVDLTLAQWEQVKAIVLQRQLLLLVDLAYQGFGRGLDEDAAGVRLLARSGAPLLICSSYSKNFGLYNERVGALTCLGLPPDAARRVADSLKVMARTLWSTPPGHGSQIVERVLGDPQTRAQWTAELAGMRDRINDMRSLLAETMQERGAPEDFTFIARQRGLFSLTGIPAAVNEIMRRDHSVYFMSTGRINVAGLTPDGVDYFCRAYLAALA